MARSKGVEMKKTNYFKILALVSFAISLSQTLLGQKVYLPITVNTANGLLNAGDLYATEKISGTSYWFNLRYVPAGTFTQGTPSDEVGRYSEEGPQFQHTLTKNLAVMETEVTRQMWADLEAVQPTLPADPTCASYGAGMSNPVQCVSWYKTILFANLLSAQQSLTRAYYTDAALTSPITSTTNQTNTVYVKWDANGYRLPTEGEWEYFTRARTSGPFSINEPAYNTSTIQSCIAGVLPVLESVAWFCANAGGATCVVGGRAANPWQLKDVHGNVWEWCWDWYGSYPGAGQTDYRGAATGSARVVRGGSWFNSPVGQRSGVRNKYNPGVNGILNFGFRLLRSLN
jgi:formylglycine-generating enzyme required for sulfatase activity